MCSTGGILYDKTGANSIDHIVSIVGWGVSTGQPGDGVPAGTKYWIGEAQCKVQGCVCVRACPVHAA